jgi:hypothetical protein
MSISRHSSKHASEYFWQDSFVRSSAISSLVPVKYKTLELRNDPVNNDKQLQDFCYKHLYISRIFASLTGGTLRKTMRVFSDRLWQTK